jgi:hypothetical protein
MYGVDWQDGSWIGKDSEESVCGLIEVVSWDVIEGGEKYRDKPLKGYPGAKCVVTRALAL